MAYIVGRCLLQKLLDERKMSQVELAMKLKVTPQQIQYYLIEDFSKRRIMTLKTAKNIATILHCRIDDLYEFIEVGNKE